MRLDEFVARPGHEPSRRPLRRPALSVLLAAALLCAGAASAQEDGPPAAGQEKNPVVGMVGKTPLRAMEVLTPLREELEERASSQRLGEFLQQARPIVAATLRECVMRRLAADEMESALTLAPDRKSYLDNYCRQIREAIVKRFGGTVEAADATLRATEGVSVDDRVADSRRDQLVRWLRQDRIENQLKVEPADVERYYAEHVEAFERPAATLVRRIDATSTDAAQRIEDALAAGTPFAEAAALAENENPRKAREQRLEAAREPELFALVGGMSEGAVTPRIERAGITTWLEVVRVFPARRIPFEEAARVAEARLREEMAARAFAEYGETLLAAGSYTSLDQMTDRALEAAVRTFVQGG